MSQHQRANLSQRANKRIAYRLWPLDPLLSCLFFFLAPSRQLVVPGALSRLSIAVASGLKTARAPTGLIVSGYVFQWISVCVPTC